ncbi:MAG: hypothetical protein HC893_08065, partial [Chloroflexaceae bacterium]|nr:hypothetical protein [Chloroflexaceae bacterium]
AAFTYDSAGRRIRQTGSTANPYRFTGERFDATLGLHSLRAGGMIGARGAS